MSWKTELKLTDLDPDTDIEVMCKRCGLTRHETPAVLLRQAVFRHAYLDQVEAGLRCANRFCQGPVRLSLTYEDKYEGFVGGMA